MGRGFRWIAAALAASASLAAHAIATQWTMIDVSPGGMARALAINAGGTVVGCRTVGSQNIAFMWANGNRADLPAPSGASSCAYAINNSGAIAGTIDNEITVWQNGAARGLGLQGEVTGIGETGAVVGSAGGRAIMISNGSVTDLGPGRAIGINRNDEVAIVSGSNLSIYDHGTLRDLGTGGSGIFNAYGFNDRDQIVGMAGLGPPGPEAFIYDGTVHQVPGSAVEGGAVAINNVGQVLVSGEGIYGALVEGGQQVTLSKLASSSGGSWGHLEGKAINDSGWIVGQETNNEVRAFLMIPNGTPAPVFTSNPVARDMAHTRPLVTPRTP